jgi:hypothetical protein
VANESSDPQELLLPVIDGLLKEEIPFMLVGSYSSNFYGIPRSTKDADIVVELGSKSIVGLERHLDARFKLDRQVQFEGITGTLKNLIAIQDSHFVIELFRLGKDPHDQERFRRRVLTRILDRSVWIPTAEDVIVMKLRWLRSKDERDIADVIAVQQGERLDWDYIYRWTDIHGTRAALDKIRQSIPPLD